MHSHLRSAVIVALSAALMGWLGYRQGYAGSVDETAADHRTGTRERRIRPVENRRKAKEDLWKLLARPVNARTSGETWDIISRYSIRQIKDALAELKTGKSGAAAQHQEAMLYFCWAQIDPLEALEAATEESKADEKKRWLPAHAFTAWMKDDPDAAYQWAMNSPGFDKDVAYRQMATLLSGMPPDEGWAKAKDFAIEVRRGYLGRIGGRMAETEEGRRDFLAMLARNGCSPEESAGGLESLMRVWGGVDPAAALAGFKDLPVDEAAREKARKITTSYWTESDPAGVIAWMSSDENPQPLGNQVDLYRKWAERSPEDAAKEFGNLSNKTPGFREGVMKTLLTSYHQGGWIPFGRNAQSDSRIFSRLKLHYDQWASTDPQQASNWINTLDPALQQRLTSPKPDEKR